MRRLKVERLKRGLGLQEVGYHVKMAASDISKIERGRLKPYPSQVQRLAAFFDMKPETILEEIDSPQDANTP